MTFDFEFTDRAREDLRKLDKSIQLLVEKKINKICENPQFSKQLHHHKNLFSERVENFRIVFEFTENKIIFRSIKKRDDIYRFFVL